MYIGSQMKANVACRVLLSFRIIHQSAIGGLGTVSVYESSSNRGERRGGQRSLSQMFRFGYYHFFPYNPWANVCKVERFVSFVSFFPHSFYCAPQVYRRCAYISLQCSVDGYVGPLQLSAALCNTWYWMNVDKSLHFAFTSPERS